MIELTEDVYNEFLLYYNNKIPNQEQNPKQFMFHVLMWLNSLPRETLMEVVKVDESGTK